MIAEEFITGAELTAPFLEDRALPLVRIVAPAATTTTSTSTSPTTRATTALRPARRAGGRAAGPGDEVLRVLGCRGWGRADLILTSGTAASCSR